MKSYFFLLLLLSGLTLRAQDLPIKWATQETFFEELIGKDLPDFQGLNMKGQRFFKSNLLQQVTVINFWFEACRPCIEEIPSLNQLEQQYGTKNVRFIGVTHDPVSRAKRFQKRSGYQYEIIHLTREEIAKLNINHGFPSNILVGKNGKILAAMANISFTDIAYKEKSFLFEKKLSEAISH